jgi:hypothetical protein
MALSSFLQELVQAVFEFLLEDIELELLAHCMLVNKSWVYPAQLCIFHTIALGVGLQGGLALRLLEILCLGPIQNLYPVFHELLIKSPHLVSYIRTLHLALPPLQSEIHPDPDFTVLSANDWRKIKEYLLDILHLLRGKGLMSLGLFPCEPGTNTFYLQPSISDII